jgi:hypothetical protein
MSVLCRVQRRHASLPNWPPHFVIFSPSLSRVLEPNLRRLHTRSESDDAESPARAGATARGSRDRSPGPTDEARGDQAASSAVQSGWHGVVHVPASAVAEECDAKQEHADTHVTSCSSLTDPCSKFVNSTLLLPDTAP